MCPGRDYLVPWVTLASPVVPSPDTAMRYICRGNSLLEDSRDVNLQAGRHSWGQSCRKSSRLHRMKLQEHLPILSHHQVIRHPSQKNQHTFLPSIVRTTILDICGVTKITENCLLGLCVAIKNAWGHKGNVFPA